MSDEQPHDERRAGEGAELATVTEATAAGLRRSVAQRPHWITIGLGLLSPAAAIVALYLSAQSLETSRTSIRVAQRAYLAIRNGQIRRSEAAPLLFRAGEPRPVNRNPVLFQWGFEIHNLGQTPGSAIEYTMRFEVPSGWSLQPFSDEKLDAVANNTRRERASDVAQRSQIDHLPGALFELTDEAMARWQSVHTDETLRVEGVLKYRDVFGDAHEITWCWEENPAQAPKSAEDEEKRHLGARPVAECP